jgi:acyl carrier protein
MTVKDKDGAVALIAQWLGEKSDIKEQYPDFGLPAFSLSFHGTIVDVLRVSDGEVLPEKSFTDGLGADSVELAELEYSLEKAFNVDLGSESLGKTVHDWAVHFARKVAEKTDGR